MSEKAFKIAENDGTFCSEYQKIVGPAGWECIITEPEDRNFYRDLAPVLDKLNDLYDRLAGVKDD